MSEQVDSSNEIGSISSDQAKTDPKDDLFGYAPFAEHIAKCIWSYREKSALTLAVYGSWGSGKSSVLNFVEHYIRQNIPQTEINKEKISTNACCIVIIFKKIFISIKNFLGKNIYEPFLYIWNFIKNCCKPCFQKKKTVENSNENPKNQKPDFIFVKFNPWWFTGKDNLAHALLNQIQAELPQEKDFEKLYELLEFYSVAIGTVIETLGAGAFGGSALAMSQAISKDAASKKEKYQKEKQKPKEIPNLKKEISTILENLNIRILITVDDVDRLMPNEIIQLFTVIRALADFPNVIYLLALDREVVVKSI